MALLAPQLCQKSVHLKRLSADEVLTQSRALTGTRQLIKTSSTESSATFPQTLLCKILLLSEACGEEKKSDQHPELFLITFLPSSKSLMNLCKIFWRATRPREE